MEIKPIKTEWGGVSGRSYNKNEWHCRQRKVIHRNFVL